MSFESRIVAFSERFLSDRTFELIVAPALADLEFDRGTGPRSRAANRFAVLKVCKRLRVEGVATHQPDRRRLLFSRSFLNASSPSIAST